MKYAISFFLLLGMLCVIPAYAQNNNNVLAPSGNVGVGTVNPTAKLQVSGRAVFDSSLVVKDSSYFLQNMRAGEDLTVEGNLRVVGQSFFYDKGYFRRITSLPGDTVIFLGDSSIVLNNGQHQIYNDFYLTGLPTGTKGLGIGHFTNLANGEFSLALGRYVQTFGNYSINLGNNLRTLNSATNSIVIGSGVSSSLRLTSSIANSLMVGFNSNKPTLFVGPSAGANTTGNVGIATDTPEDKFQVVVDPFHSTLTMGSAFVSGLNWGNVYLGFNVVRQPTGWKTYNNGSNNGGAIIYANPQGHMYFTSIRGTNAGVDQTNISDNTVLTNTKMFIDGNTGNVGIGTTCTPYKLTVEGSIASREVWVKVTSWCDYVFDPSYPILSYDSLQNYIEVNKHLPNVPSQQEIEKQEGYSMVEVNKAQMEKIEELTLYILNLNQRLEELEKKYREAIETSNHK